MRITCSLSAIGRQSGLKGGKVEQRRLVTLLENRLLQLAAKILNDDQSSMANCSSAIKHEIRIYSNRGFSVPTRKSSLSIRDDEESVDPELVGEISRSTAARANYKERLKIYRRAVEREERRSWITMNQLEKLDDKRTLMKNVSGLIDVIGQ